MTMTLNSCLFSLALALTSISSAYASYTGSLTFVQPTGTVTATEEIPVWLRLTLDSTSDPLVLTGNSADTPPFGVPPSNYPPFFDRYGGTLVSVDNIFLQT